MRADKNGVERAKKVLIVDDDERFRELCKDISEGMGLITSTANDGIEALEKISEDVYELALVDLKMPRMGGLDLLHHLRDINPGIPVIIITAYGSIDTAVEAMKLGAVDYIVKPCTVESVRNTISNILERWKLSFQTSHVIGVRGRFGIIGNSSGMKTVYQRIEAMLNTDNTVIIMGESGVGKELVARAIHFHGKRASEPFIPIDCSVLNLNIVESELFGHIKGAFTDARYNRDGLLKLAGRGTLFLDEITEIPLEVQSKLLRAIQEKEIRPLGSSKIEKFEARILAATNRDLKKAVQEGRFREDLFYRLHVIPISIPPLRERKEDISILADHFIKKYSTERRRIKGLSPDALQILLSYSWPGNVRELENVIQQAIVLGTSDWIRKTDLPPELLHPVKETAVNITGVKPIVELEKEAIANALRFTAGHKLEAARLLGIGKTTLYEKIKRYGLEGMDLI